MDDTPDEIAELIDTPEPDDAPALACLFDEDMSHLGVDLERADLEELADRIIADARRDPPGCLCWVVRSPQGRAGGVVVANCNWSLKFAGRALWIEELYVTPEHRRSGLGRALVDRVVAYAEDHDIRGIDLEAYQGNTPASVLYRTAGFHRLGRERFYKRIGPGEFL